MAFAFIGEAAASGIIGRLVEAAYTAMQEKLLPADDVEEELDNLKHTLPQIKAVLSAVESDEIKNRNDALIAWMWLFRDAVESADDVLDEMAYYELEKEIQSQNEKVVSLASSLKRKFGTFVNRMFKADNHGISKRLAGAVKDLDKVASSVHNFLGLERGSGRFRGKMYEGKNIESDRETGSMITENVVFGRVKERDLIVEWLTVDPSIDNVTLSAFTIHGIGGLGKTTLAQLIYKDEKIKQFFDPIIWVCVSDQFDVVTIIGKILESKGFPTIRSLTSLQDTLKEWLISKRFLLVLDDVWNDENRSQWEKLVAPLKFGYGKILVTTRMESVADMIDKVIERKTDRLKLDGLEEKDFLMLFNKHAFDGADPDEYGNLHPIGKQIAMKLGGCPLAAKIMGGVLNYSIELEYWTKVLKEEIPNFHVGKDDIMVVLRLSYCHLPTYLQLCFRYCSIFPKDYEFRKDELIKMWMGSGLIEPGFKKQMPEDVGREYFNRLVRKSFFDLNSKNFYVMHDLLHDLAQSVSEGECMRIEGSASGIPGTTRHLNSNMQSLPTVKEISHLKNLRTLLITLEGDIPGSGDIEVFSEVLKKLKSLRLLRIKITWECLFKMPDAIGELIHLRYLSHELTSAMDELPWFPKSVYKLYHLEIIKFEASYIKDMEEHEANGIVNLTKLRYLDVGSEILKQIANIGKLTFLQELESFPVGSESGHMINELRDLRSLRKLAVTNLDKVLNPAEAKEAKLNVKENLNSLSLIWPQGNMIIGNTRLVHEQILDNLQPHTNLQELKIEEYGGTRYPFWMTHTFLVNLISLDLCRCFFLESLPTLGKLRLLKHLRLMNFPQVRKIDQTFYGNGIECAFPVLKELTIQGMQELKDWDEVQGMTLFPRLEKLVVDSCPKLTRLPSSLPPSLKHLEIWKVQLETLPRIHPSNNNGTPFPPSLSYLRVKDCPNLTSLDECLSQQHEGMRSLTNLELDKCEMLMHLPLRGFIDCTSLKDITIDKCPLLMVAPGTLENLLPCSIQNLTIGRCGVDVPLLASMHNCTALIVLKLEGCPHISSLPPFEILTKLKALHHLIISCCPELSSLGGLHALTSLKSLKINNCENLTAMSSSQPPLSAIDNDSNQLQLGKLIIDNPSLLRLEPLRSLRLTQGLRIMNASDLTCLPEEWLLQNRSTLLSIHVEGARRLELLPSCMDKLELLDRLEIDDAPLIESLPDMPASLSDLWITGCNHELMEKYKKDGGPEWHRIAFISCPVFSCASFL
ncbi:hypothetical protein LUZ60_000450 [Juncus effusus]|nr:hypothetical protein LUZ60_000450 [Juncus effusus]